jgi:hypothetical protein
MNNCKICTCTTGCQAEIRDPEITGNLCSACYSTDSCRSKEEVRR